MPTIEEINDLCREIAEETMADNVDDLEEEELNNMMLAMGPRAFGPDADEGANDCDGLFYWDLK
jgi:hypothetical protein